MVLHRIFGDRAAADGGSENGHLGMRLDLGIGRYPGSYFHRQPGAGNAAGRSPREPPGQFNIQGSGGMSLDLVQASSYFAQSRTLRVPGLRFMYVFFFFFLLQLHPEKVRLTSSEKEAEAAWRSRAGRRGPGRSRPRRKGKSERSMKKKNTSAARLFGALKGRVFLLGSICNRPKRGSPKTPCLVARDGHGKDALRFKASRPDRSHHRKHRFTAIPSLNSILKLSRWCRATISTPGSYRKLLAPHKHRSISAIIDPCTLSFAD